MNAADTVDEKEEAVINATCLGSPSVRARKIVVNEQQRVRVYGPAERNLIKYLAQCLFGLILMLVSVGMIASRSSESNEVWIGLVCTIAGIFLPHPTPENKNES